ncbi:MAG: hypothetical protein HYT36_03220 [Candidatus Staskawiczbacteria bacterium]|nr:hypothetical protein [Candidatus Staskawiczbacteria bacterium]
MMPWGIKSSDNKKYIGLSERLNDVGKNLGGWHGKLTKQKPFANLDEMQRAKVQRARTKCPSAKD